MIGWSVVLALRLLLSDIFSCASIWFLTYFVRSFYVHYRSVVTLLLEC